LPEWKKHATATKGLQVFVDALETARVRPTITQYPQISQHLGEATVAVLLGRKSPGDALGECVKACNALLAVPS
jgi:multiple sugar transport system substrate-binding protein